MSAQAALPYTQLTKKYPDVTTPMHGKSGKRFVRNVSGPVRAFRLLLRYILQLV
jgi:hypothetical protein